MCMRTGGAREEVLVGHTGAQHHVGDELIADAAGAPLALICPAISAGRAAVVPPAPHKDFSDLYETMSGKGESASEAHLPERARRCEVNDHFDHQRVHTVL